MIKRNFIASIATVFFSFVFFMDEAYSAETQGSVGLPQLDPSSFASQIFWLLVSFIILYIFLTRSPLPKITDVKNEREIRLDEDKRNIEELKAETDKTTSDYEKIMSEARRKAREIVAAKIDEIQGQISREKETLTQKLNKKLEDSTLEIKNLKQKSILEVEKIAIDVVEDILSQFVNQSVEKDEIKKAVNSALQE